VSRPLVGRRIAVTRSASTSHELVDRLVMLGADVVAAPVIKSVAPLDNGSRLAATLAEMDATDFLVVTSAKGVKAVVATGIDVSHVRTAAVGGATARALVAAGFQAPLVPNRQLATDLAALLGSVAPGSAKAVFAAAANAGTDLEDGLRATGWTVQRCVGYRTVGVSPPECVITAACSADAVLFTSGSTVRGWLDAGGDPEQPAISIGPTTTAAAGLLGQRIAAEAANHDLRGLCTALIEFLVPEASARS